MVRVGVITGSNRGTAPWGVHARGPVAVGIFKPRRESTMVNLEMKRFEGNEGGVSKKGSRVQKTGCRPW